MGTELLIFVREEGTARGEWRSEDVEVAARDDLRGELFRFADARERQRREPGQGRSAEDRLLVSQIGEVRPRGAPEELRRAVPYFARTDHHDARDVADGHRTQQDGVDEREHRRIGADTQRQRDDGDERHARCPKQLSPRPSQVRDEHRHTCLLRPARRD
jgi:hypothetical protein